MPAQLDCASASGTSVFGKRLFSFAVVADTHVNQEEGKASSDFAVNRLSNARNRHVIHEINRIAPAFVLHLGDIVHPTPIHPGYATAAASFHALAAELACPLYLTPGNHDVGDKPGDWLPVPSVSDEFLALYRQHFGENYYSFDANGCHFVIIDAQIVNSGLACEAAQKTWLEQDLAANAGRRIFLCTHYPPYLYEPAEDGHYDNIDEPGRAWLLGLFKQYSVEAVFAGHVHNFWYHLHGETEIYLLPSTAFVRLDYSELFRIEAAAERGRNDAPKLGFFLVDVHERGHVAHAIRTFGAMLAPGATLDHSSKRLPPVHTKSIAKSPVGIDLRYPWAETVEVAPSGALDEFGRKAARNDYPLMSLWEMGIRRLRVPLGDLVNPLTRERMRVLRRIGHEFTVYSHGVPGGALRDALVENSELIAGWEVVAARRRMTQVVEQVCKLKEEAPLAAYLSKLHRHDDEHHHGERARHVIQHGFSPDEQDEIRELLARDEASKAFDGFLFRVSRDNSPLRDIRSIAQSMHALGKQGSAYVRLAAENTAVAMEDDLAIANRVAEAVIAVFTQIHVRVWLDTFSDVDRGYFPRAGLVDRRYNPRVAGHVCRSLHSAFDASASAFSLAGVRQLPGVQVLTLNSRHETWIAALPAHEVAIDSLPCPIETAEFTDDATWIDLGSGSVRALACALEGDGGGACIRMVKPVTINAPALFRFPH